MKVNKAVITIAGKGQRTLPLQMLIDRDGQEKSVLAIILEEVVAAGVDEIGLVIRPGDEAALTAVAGDHAGRLQFVLQERPLGYGHAIHCARDFVGDDGFLHLVGDHIYISRGEERCAKHLVRVAEREGCSVSAVQSTREHLLPYFGVVGGQRVAQRQNLYRVDTVLEKTTPTEAEQKLIVPGQRAGHYLCFFGMHVLSATIMGVLDKLLGVGEPNRVWLSQAIHQLAQREQVLALAKQDWRYDLGAKYGVMMAQMALAMSGQDRNLVLSQLVELMALREMN